MANPLSRYIHWLHTKWPAGTVEKLPLVNDDGSTNVPGVYIVGDLTGIPLLKFSSDTGARAVRTIAASTSFQSRDTKDDGVVDIAIVGGGVSGFAAALEATKQGLSYKLYEASEPFSTIVNFPKAKPIYTYPTDLTPAGDLQFHEKSDVKEGLLEDLREQTIEAGIEPTKARVESVKRVGRLLDVTPADGDVVRAHAVVIGIGRSGNFRKLGIPGEEKDKVYNRLHDPKEYSDQDVLVVGGGDSALEAAIALAGCGARVTVSYRKPEFARPKPENVEKLDALGESVNVMMASKPKQVRDDEVVITDRDGKDQTIPNNAVFTMIGREPPLDFFRRSGIRIRGEWKAATYISFVLFLMFCVWLYHWKSGKIPAWGIEPAKLWGWLDVTDPTSLLYTLKASASGRSFYYTLTYCLCVFFFGMARIKRRKTPYVKLQTWTLIAIQFIPLFLLPEIILPWMGRNGLFAEGTNFAWIADQFFERYDTIGHDRAYWRAYGFILAWPLFVYNFFTATPMWGWIIVGSIQTFVIIPALIYKFGKGAYCGWICSCGALAETMGDTHRHKMPHGPFWNRLNLIGQAFLVFATVLMILRIGAWVAPESSAQAGFDFLFENMPVLNYRWFVDLLWAGVIGVGFYFWFSGRVWCRFACPLAALMHIYARFSRFRIIAEKKKCISCNVCTSVCHQGIDVMNFANKGLGMEDPECVRCSACVQSCPTGVLSFGEVDRATGDILKTDSLGASPVQMAELTIEGRTMNERKLNRSILAAAAAIVLLVFGGAWGAVSLARNGGMAAAASIVAASQPASSQPASSQPATSQPARGDTSADHSALDAILQANVREGLIDYLAIRDKHMPTLNAYLAAMATVDHANLPKWDRFAFYVNVYNATVMREVIKRYKPGYSVANSDYSLFSDNVVKLTDGLVSLDTLEKKMTWNAFHDPRMHVAFVCGAVSCPPILPRAYTGQDMDAVLNANMKAFVAGAGDRNRIDAKARKAELSQIFNWYASDFGGKDKLASYIDQYHAADLSKVKITFMDYDWTLNVAK